ncbi:ATP-binding cassette domain-containing protein [Paenibacillus sp. YYML68]|uniref:ATP-binding cassette domain-containing protein n=1 Tax=Paenibacillus sp. YYML68 TaxID=2909250 RepID=UPI0024935377|nr:ATP-binding cassette domain-containing protein [Paenibacillus sp. YYML68]
MHIRLEQVAYTYDAGSPFERPVLRDVTLELPSGRIIGLVGRTGSGKSTLVQLVKGLLQPTSGSIQAGDDDLTSASGRRPSWQESVGLVFQQPEHQLFEDMVYSDIAFGPRNLGWTEEKVRATVLDALHQVGLSDGVLEQPPLTLSGGQKRRVAIAGVLAMQPRVLILDEPTAGLDPRGQQLVLTLIQQWQQSSPERTVIWITHEMEHIAELCTDVMVLDGGTVRYQTTPLQLFTTHRQELEELGLALPPAVRLLEAIQTRLGLTLEVRSVRKADILATIAASYLQKAGRI